jgi:integrase
MAAEKLNNRDIAGFVYDGDGKSRYVRWDTEVRGLGVRVYPSGRKSFMVGYRVSGRWRTMVLGNYGTMTLSQAREQARRLLVDARDGKDPLDEKRKISQGETFGDLIEAYMERHAKVHKRTWPADERRLKLHIPTGWMGRKAGAITREEIAKVHHNFGLRAPYEANRLLEVLHKMFSLAKVWGFIEDTAANPVEGVPKFKEKKRKRWVTPEELPRLATAIDAVPNIYIRGAIWLFILTGVRRDELLSAKWDDVLWERGQLRLPRTKTGEEQHAALSGPAMAILQAVPRQEGNPYIIPGAKPGQHLVNIDKAWGIVRKAIGAEDLRLHDLRRTVGSWLSQSGVDLNLIKDALRHSDIGTTLTYARLGENPAREVMEDHARRILEAAGRRGPVAMIDGGGGK